MNKQYKWFLRSRDIDEIVSAPDQFAAYETLRDRPGADFGLIVTAHRADLTEDEGSYACRTSLLMGQWGRIAEAKAFVKAGIAYGMGDMTDLDIPAEAQ